MKRGILDRVGVIASFQCVVPAILEGLFSA